MKATDLRIGNWVNIKDLTHAPKTWRIEGVGNLIQVGGQLWSIEELQPIPLTEEWLERFESDVKWRITKDYNDLWAYWVTEEYSVSIRYVHELQNLDYAITGEELTLKLTE